MLRGFIICPDQELRGRIEGVLTELGQVAILRMMDSYVSGQELSRYIRAYAPEVIFLSIESMPRAFELVQVIERDSPGVQVVALHHTCDPQTLLEVMRVGIREFLAPPFQHQVLHEALGRLEEIIQKNPPVIESADNIFAFLPSKAGVGTTTIAVNTAFAMAGRLNLKGLMMDMDMGNGIVRFMLKLSNAHSIVDAVEHVLDMDINLWPQLVTNFGVLDVLHAGRIDPDFRIEATQMRHLLDFARRNYQFVSVDLSGNLERYSLEVMHEAKRIFLVCTPEIPSLHLAREKLSYLEKLDLSQRVSVVLNRVHRRSLISPEQVRELLGIPVVMILPNDYQGVHRSLQSAKPVDADSELGKKFLEMAQQMQQKPARKSTQAGSKFVSYFSVLPGRYGNLEPKKSAS